MMWKFPTFYHGFVKGAFFIFSWGMGLMNLSENLNYQTILMLHIYLYITYITLKWLDSSNSMMGIYIILPSDYLLHSDGK